MANEQGKGLSEQEVLAIYVPLAKAGKSWAEIMQAFPDYNQATLQVRISNIRKKRSEKLQAMVDAQRKAGKVITPEDFNKLEEKLVNAAVPKILTRANRVSSNDAFANEFNDAFAALAALTGEQKSDSESESA